MKLVSFNSPKFSLYFLALFVSFQASADRTGFAKKFSIPPIEDSHIVMGQTYVSELDPNSIKVLVWNLLKAERKDWSKDFTKLAEKKDLLFLQEGYLNPVMESTFDQMYPFRFDFGVSFLYNKDNYTPTGSVLGSKVTPISTGVMRSRDLEPFIKTPKMITYGVYPIADSSKELLALTIHGVNFTTTKAFKNQINDAIKLIDQHDGPVVFAGDFNTRNQERMKFLRSKMFARDFKEVTFWNDKRKSFLGVPLDHAFAKGMLVRDSRVVVDVKSSDHKALEIEFAVDPAAN